MCGIVGFVGDASREQAIEIVRRMSASIVHRGPDDEGHWGEDGFAFGMRRLSIIDLEGGHQPMWEKRSGLGVVFNGEIYNYREIQKRLTENGYQLETHADTECVLATLAQSGPDAVHEWNGMFAVAAWNPRTRELTLIRDRLGKKPLYYYWDGKNLLFASEIKALLASGLIERRLNQQAVWDYLTFRYVPGPESIWEGIRKLPPGHILEFKSGDSPKERAYWQTNVEFVANGNEAKTELQLEKEFTDLFLDAVQLRLVASDVPVGVLLSGGLDSSAVAAAAVEMGHRNFHTFSVGFDTGGYYSELPYARQVADYVGAIYHEVVIDQKAFLDLLPKVVYHNDEPIADLASVPLLAVSQLARKNVKVVLSGEGSDEVLAGYELGENERHWQIARMLQSVPRPLLKAAAGVSTLLGSGYNQRIQKIADKPVSSWNKTDRPHITRYFRQQEKLALWPGHSYPDSDDLLGSMYGKTRSRDPLEQLLTVYQQSWLVEDLLMKADKMSMATSVELRTPFLDYRLVEWANHQPKTVKVKRTGLLNYETKNVLRRFCASRLPKEILTRPKRGFPVPVNSWLQSGLNDWARDILLDSSSRSAKAFSKEFVSERLSASKNGDLKAAGDVWLLIVLELWLRKWEVDLM